MPRMFCPSRQVTWNIGSLVAVNLLFLLFPFNFPG